MDKNKRYRNVMTCEVCGEPLKTVLVDEDGWAAECSDSKCRALHQGAF